MVTERSWELGYNPHDIVSSDVTQHVSHARHEVMRTVRDEIVMPNGKPPSYPLIGRWFGRDHTTVIPGIRKARERMLSALVRGEIVHHIDGNRRNNEPSNLEVMTQSEHARIHMLERYRK